MTIAPPPSIEPATQEWSAILLPAVLGQPDAAMAAMEQHLHANAAARDPRLLRISARAMMAMGEPDVALDLLHLIRAPGDVETDLLLAFAEPESPSTSWLLGSLLGSPGLSADHCCDVAALALAHGDQQTATQAVCRGLLICPDHGELGRWRRFLSQTPPELACRAVAARMGGRPLPPNTLRGADEERFREDVMHLTPSATCGWLTPERITRKVLSGAWEQPSPAGSGLERVQQAGCTERHFHSDEELAAMPAAHIFVDMEILTDRVLSLLEEHRPAVSSTRHLWAQMKALPSKIYEPGAYLLAITAIADAQCMDVGLAAVNWMLRMHRRRGRHTRPSIQHMRWTALRARLLLSAGQHREARRLAEDVLQQPWLPAVVLRLAQETLTLAATPQRSQDTDRPCSSAAPPAAC